MTLLGNIAYGHLLGIHTPYYPVQQLLSPDNAGGTSTLLTFDWRDVNELDPYQLYCERHGPINFLFEKPAYQRVRNIIGACTRREPTLVKGQK